MNHTIHLTLREQEVLELTSWGLSKKEVASKLCVCYRTVDVFVRHLHEKLGLNKATELAAVFFAKKFEVKVCDIPESARRRIATALLALSLFSIIFETTDMLRTFRSARANRTTEFRARFRRATRGREDYLMEGLYD
jgi:DNA-binding CsgD family transcriptional regulator